MSATFTQYAQQVILSWQRISERAQSVAYAMQRGGLITSQEYDEIERNIQLLKNNVPLELQLTDDTLLRDRFVSELVLVTRCLRDFELQNLFAALLRRAVNPTPHKGFHMGNRLEGFLRDAQIQHWREVITVVLFTAGLLILAFASNVPGLSAWGLAIGAGILALAFASLTLIRPWN